MSKIVIILGAGASKTAGAPLMNEFIDVAEHLYATKQVEDAKEHFELFFEGYQALRLTAVKANVDSENIESLLTAFEMADLLGHFAKFSDEEIKSLPKAAKRVIVKTLQHTVRFLVSSNGTLPPSSYQYFYGGLFHELRPKRFHNQLSIITFNYDLCSDFSLEHHKKKIDYCFTSSPSKDADTIKLLKLHGSLNWAYCNDCEQIYSFDYKDEGCLTRVDKGVYFDVTKSLSKHPVCKHGTPDDIFIVPPTLNKLQYQKQIQSVWKAAANELSNAEHIFVCGYSLPETDMFFHYLYALGTSGKSRIKSFVVMDKASGNYASELEERYRNLLAPSVAANSFEFISGQAGDFSNAVSHIVSHLNK